jgi:hypothetical protein
MCHAVPVPLVTGIGHIENADFTVDQVLDSATLTGTAELLNLFDGQLLQVDVDLAWLANGNPQGIGGSTGVLPGATEIVTFQGIQRLAVATGTVFIRPSPYDRGLAGLNLAPDSSTEGQIVRSKTNVIPLPISAP